MLVPSYGQQISIEFGPNKIPIETYFTISLRLKGVSLKEASPFPELEGFQKSSRFTKRTTLKSGNNLLEEVHTQNYAALNEGTFVIEPFNITVNGRTVTSAGITVQVGPISENPDPVSISNRPPPVKTSTNQSEQSFLDLETSKNNIYTGEGVHVALYFYLIATENGQLEFYDFLKQLPELFRQLKQPNTWEEVYEQTEILPDTLELNKNKYLRYKLYEAINYPLNSQDLVFPSLNLKMIKYSSAPDATFANEKRRSEIKNFPSRPTIVKVKSLPPHPLREAVPVGRYRLDETIEHREIKLNKTVNYAFSIIGEGNISALQAPVLPTLSGLEIYPPVVKEKILRLQQRISGSKQFAYSIVPKAPGNYRLANLIQFVYFDPVREQYDTLTSKLTIKVTGNLDRDAFIGSGVSGEFYKLIQTEDNTLVSIHKFEKLKLYTNLIVLLLLAISVYIFFRKN